MSNLPQKLADFLRVIFYTAGFSLGHVDRHEFYWNAVGGDRTLRVGFVERTVSGAWYVSVKYSVILWGRTCRVFAATGFSVYEHLPEPVCFDRCRARIDEIASLVHKLKNSDACDVYLRDGVISVIFDDVVALVDYQNADAPMSVYLPVHGAHLTQEQRDLFEDCEYEGVRS